MKKIREKVCTWVKDVAILIKENKKIALITLGFIAIIVVGIVLSSILTKPAPEETIVADIEAVTEYVITDEPLEKDAYPEINELMDKYYLAVSEGDVSTIEAIKSPVYDTEKILIEKKSKYIESYPTVDVYTKKGPVDDSYLVFANYEAKLYDYDSLLPGVNAWYVCKDENGEYHIDDDSDNERLVQYCKVVSAQDDVIDLDNVVSVKYNETMANDEEFAEYVKLLPSLLAKDVGEELSKANEPEEEETAEEVVEEIQDLAGKTAKTVDVVYIRSSDSMESDRVDKAQKGQEFEVIEQKVNGWTKIKYKDKECFIKSEYLEIDGVDNGQTESNADANAPTDEITDEEAAANSPSSGKAKARDTINIRKSDSTSAEKVTVAYKGEEMTVVEKQTNGWTKVKYNGKTGYVKSEYLEK